MLKKLYHENPYEKEFTVEIINIIEKNNEYHVVLDKSYFYPGDEVQPVDSGSINEIPVLSVYEDNGTIYHVLKTKPIKIHRVKCNIDFVKRFDFMQQHSGQLILAACLKELFNLTAVKFNIGENASYIDLNKIIEKEEIIKLENMANKIVLDNVKIEMLKLKNAELKKISIKKNTSKPNEETTVIKIGEYYSDHCNSLFPASTMEVQMIKIIKLTKLGSGTRIEFICGSRALTDYLLKFEAVDKMAKLLSCEDAKVLSIVENLKGDLNKALAEKGSLKAEVADYEVQKLLNSCENLGSVRILKTIYDNVDFKYITLLANKLTSYPKVIILFGVKSEDKANLLFMCSKDINYMNMSNLLKDAVTLIDGKGGGSNFSAQGGGKNNNNLDSSIDYAYKKVVDFIHSGE